MPVNKGYVNLHSLIYDDRSNIANLSNEKLYSSVLNGYVHSNAFDYLLNVNSIRLSDIRSLGFFNESGIANKMNDIRGKEELIDHKHVFHLPKPKKLKANLVEILENRQSIRNYAEQRMEQKELSTLLKYAIGIKDSKKGRENSIHRYYSSGGALYPISVFVYIHNVEYMKNGVYLYQPYSHSLLLKTTHFTGKEFLADNVLDTQNCNIILLFHYEINRNYLKYGELSLLLALIEAGIMAQNIHLLANALHYSSCDAAGFNKRYAEEQLQLDGINSHIIHSLIIGKER
ncbi:SagB family peptide dehydrogenase [Fervidibacillus halotolerans]|uniref:SagB family peptide dehydrogenase n=1 Tax=Fervidibacillus halotolerans TaxID=2980027 RepID=A0A9E8LZG0_9BACI|nr:SagB family peptide dehydrogenase [Fervidibacillus halotolerans]WAA12658.1 SagB family peptide dehydrogenase [Fervidibacillus halotolerans]